MLIKKDIFLKRDIFYKKLYNKLFNPKINEKILSGRPCFGLRAGHKPCKLLKITSYGL
jgi:hypothetical protein